MSSDVCRTLPPDMQVQTTAAGHPLDSKLAHYMLMAAQLPLHLPHVVTRVCSPS